MSISNSMKIAITEIQEKLDPKTSVESNLEKAMKLAMNHWLAVQLPEDQQFRCAIGAVMLSNPDARNDLAAELQVLRSLSAMMTGVPVDIETVHETTKDRKKYGLLPMWKKLRREER